MRTGKLEEAAKQYEKLSEIESDPKHITLGKAAILERQGKTEEAYAMLEPLVTAGNDDEDFLVLLAILESQLGKRAEAVDRLESVIESSTRNQIRISFELGHIYDKLGDYDRAMDRFKRGNNLKASHFDQKGQDNRVVSRIEVFGANQSSSIPSAENESQLLSLSSACPAQVQVSSSKFSRAIPTSMERGSFWTSFISSKTCQKESRLMSIIRTA